MVPKIQNKNYTLIPFLLLFALACSGPYDNTKTSGVKIIQKNGKYSLTLHGQTYQVKGVGIGSSDESRYKALAEAGGNTFRTWGADNLAKDLEFAQKYNLMIVVGFEMQKELHGFDYTKSPEEVEKQFQEIKNVVDRYKNHPHILCWLPGNELNLLFDEAGKLKLVNPAVYKALNRIVEYIHQADPNHPVGTTFAGVNKEHIDLALKHCPNLDFLGLQVYGDLISIPQLVKKADIKLPYMITEYGPRGHWEMPATEWGREIEEPSALKASGLMNRIQKGILENDNGLEIGTFAFLWGQKQERTPTWYGMFNKSGEQTAVIDELTKFWTGAYPKNRAPLSDSIKLDNRSAVDNIYLKPGSEYQAQVFVREPDQDSLRYEWVILKEVGQRSQGGAFEKEPEAIEFKILKNQEGQITFIAPSEEGDYRLFSYAHDGKGKVGNANIPFYVKKGE